MIPRPYYLKQLKQALRRSPVVALLGPRQCGKTTLARMLKPHQASTYFDLESQPDLRRLQNPEMVLGSLHGTVIIDEIQEMPELFKVLRVLVDRPGNKAHYLVLGSASPDIVKNVSETLAGRVEFIELAGFDLHETGFENLDKLWLKGGFPRSFLARSEEESLIWREGFVRTFLERDIPHLGFSIPSVAMRRFWTMLAHYHGQTWNASEISRSMGLSDKTVRSYLDLLTGTFMIRQLQPWFENINKRQVKAPKIYFRDSGILHCLLDIINHYHLMSHPRVGSSWEGFALEQIAQTLKVSNFYFWATHGGVEIDLFFLHHGHRYGIEFKFNEAPKVTNAMHSACEVLHLKHLWLIYPGSKHYAVNDTISVLPLKDISILL